MESSVGGHRLNICWLLIWSILIIHLGLVAGFKTKFVDNDSAEEEMKQMRRTEISKALLLLKKHSVVGNDAKIVLKNNGKHLLVDPSERIRVVANHLTKRTNKNFKITKLNKPEKLAQSASSNHHHSLNSKLSNISPSFTSNHRSKKSSNHKTSKNNHNADLINPDNNNNNNNNHHHNPTNKLNRKELKKSEQLQKSTKQPPGQQQSTSVETLQRNIMRRAASKSVDVIDSLMGQKMLKEITQLVSGIVRNRQARTLVELSDLITDSLNQRYGPHWHTISVASPKAFANVATSSNTNKNKSTTNTAETNRRHNQLLIESIMTNQNQLNSLTHVALDDHQKSAIFYATFDFGRTLRIFIFK